MPPVVVWLLVVAVLAVWGWGLATWHADDELTARERVVLDALTRLWERRQ
jgi:hypothetical protein